MSARLLIADDSTTIQKVFERTFPPEEFTLTFANNGEEAMAKARKGKPDLIIADINMPVKNGFEVCEEVKKDSLLKNIPVLLLIGILDDFDEDESNRVGADGFIVKPFESNAAISKVREALTVGKGALPRKEKAEIAFPPEEKAEEAEELFPREEAVEKEEEEVLELADVVEEPIAEPPKEEKEEEFVLKTPLRELETELQEQFHETEEEKEEALTLDLPIDELEPEPIMAKGVEEKGLFGELLVEEEERRVKDERLETILDESATEFDRIEALTPKREKREIEREKFEERFVEPFEPAFKAKEEDLKEVGALEKGLEGALKDVMEGFAERLATVLGHELKGIVAEAIKETVPELVREEIEKLR
jgi:CheY-like chemotaxis protein